MSYTALEEIPFNIRRCYDTDDLMVWMTKYNEFYTKIKAGEIEVPDYCSNDAMYARELAFDTCKYLPSSRFVEASSTVEVLDRQNEVADIESYYDGSKEFIDFGGIGIQQHSSKVISTIWKAYKGIDEATGQPAIFTCENYFRGKKMYDDAWYAVLNGGLSEKSIGSRIDPAKTKTECDENGCHNRVYADQWFELSSVFRGANPRTYIIDKHEALKSFGNVHIVAINDRYKMCPVKEKYLSFKSDVADVDPTARVHYLDDGLMYISGSNGEMYKQIISQHYPDAQTVKGSIENVGNFIIGYLMLFFVGFPVFGDKVVADPSSWTIWLLHAGGAIMFFGQGLFAVAIIMQMQSTIEYNEFKFGERKEALVSSMRALVAKFSSAIQRLLIFLTLLLSGLYAISQVISNSEAELASGSMTTEELVEKVNSARETITNGQWMIFSIGMLWIPLILLCISLFLSVFVFKIDEFKYKEMVDAINGRRSDNKD